MRLCKSSQADMNGLTYSAASRSRLVRRSCCCDSAHVQTAHSPIATEMSHCMGSSPSHSSGFGSFSRSGSRRFSVASPGAAEIMNASYYRWGLDNRSPSARLPGLEQLEESLRGVGPGEARHVPCRSRSELGEVPAVLVRPLELLHDLLEIGVGPDPGRLAGLAHGGLAQAPERKRVVLGEDVPVAAGVRRD